MRKKWMSEQEPAPARSRPFVRFSIRGLAARWFLILGTVLSCSALGWAVLASPAQAVSTGTTVSPVSFSPPTIRADGSSTTAATVTVTDALGANVVGETVVFSSNDPGQQVSTPAHDNGGGTYTAVITSSTTPGTAIITATDTSAPTQPSNTGTLTQTGPAFQIAVSVSPTSVLADGSSTSTATATVTDAQGHPLSGETIGFSSDLGNQISTPVPKGNGVYVATITSTTAVRTATITATDGSASGSASLTQTAGSAAHVVVTLSPSSILANGSSTSTATASVTDAQGHPLAAEAVGFSSSDPGEHIGATINNHDGTYTATITSSTTVGTATITASDGFASGQTTLTQTAGPPGRVAVTLSPSSILANGSSTSTATASVTDAQGHPLAAEAVSFSSSDPGGHISATTNNHDGTYTATITSSTTVGFAAITATDTSVTPRASGQALLGQAANSSATTLTVVANAPVTNQGVTLIATVTSSSSAVAPKGALTFEDHGHPISGCGPLPVVTFGQSATVTCPTSFSAQTSPAQLTAVFTSSSGSAVADSTSASHDLLVGQGGTSISLRVPSSRIKVGSRVTYRATVTDSLAGPFQPSGSVQFLDHGKLIAPCANQTLVLSQGLLTAQCRVQYAKHGPHTITARYGGDGGFAASLSSRHPIDVQPIRPVGRIIARTYWRFVFALHSTRITMMRVLRARAGTTVLILCRGGGCSSPLRAIQVHVLRVCHHGRCRTQTTRPLDLVPTLRTYRLRPRTVLTIELVRRYWTGKAYVFTIRSGHGPRDRIRCLAPGSTRPVLCPAH